MQGLAACSPRAWRHSRHVRGSCWFHSRSSLPHTCWHPTLHHAFPCTSGMGCFQSLRGAWGIWSTCRLLVLPFVLCLACFMRLSSAPSRGCLLTTAPASGLEAVLFMVFQCHHVQMRQSVKLTTSLSSSCPAQGSGHLALLTGTAPETHPIVGVHASAPQIFCVSSIGSAGPSTRFSLCTHCCLCTSHSI